MPAPTLLSVVSEFDRLADQLQAHLTTLGMIPPTHQHMVAETIMIRLFGALEIAIEGIALRLGAGATYRSGLHPALMVSSRSIGASYVNYQQFNRTTHLGRLSWTTSKACVKNVKKVMSTTDSFIVQVKFYGSQLNEMRRVRNHIAHRSSSTRADYRSVIQQTYGANLRIQVGPFLISTRRHPTAKLVDYIAWSRAIVRDLAAG